MNYILLESEDALKRYLMRFETRGFHIIALDIEAESNLHSYGEKICLLQIFDGSSRVIADPFKMKTRALSMLFENPKILKVMYDAGSDLSLLKNSIGIEVKSILDIRPAVDLLDFKKKDLHSVLASELDVCLENKRMYQKYNWTNRPIAPDAIEYALNDVIYLLALKDRIMKRLHLNNLTETFFLANLQIQHKDYTRNPEDRYRKLPGFGRLPDSKKKIFRSVFAIREKYAKLSDMPPNSIIRKGDIIKIVNNVLLTELIRFSRGSNPGRVSDMLRELRAAVNPK